MKVAIIFLFACIAVSQAAFTANLVQRAQPILAKTFAQARLQVRTRTEDGLQTTLFQTLSEHANELLAQIQTGISTGVEVAQSLYDQLNATLAELSALGGNAVDAAISIIGNLWDSLFGRWGSKRAFDITTITNILSNLGLDQLINGLFEQVVSLIASIQIPEFLSAALSTLFNNEIVQSIMSALFGRQRGLFGDLLGQLTGAASNLVNQIAGFLGTIQDQLATGLTSVAIIAQQILADAQNQVVALTQQAADALITQLAPFAQDMGVMYEQIVAAINSMINKH